MSKYCLRLDRSIGYGLAVEGKEVLPGCEIYGVHHDCDGCPNLMEMGDEPYNTIANKTYNE